MACLWRLSIMTIDETVTLCMGYRENDFIHKCYKEKVAGKYIPMDKEKYDKIFKYSSHGICKECYDKTIENIMEYKK